MASDLPPPYFAHPALDRASHLRDEENFLARAVKQEGASLVLFAKTQPLVEKNGIFPANPANLPPSAQEKLVFLGLDEKKRPWFALSLEEAGMAEYAREFAQQGGQFEDLRQLAMQGRIAPEGLAILAQARALLEWHQSHQFCSRCGSKSRMASAGHKRICSQCRTEHFPRTDPVVIMLAEFSDKIFLARQSGFPAGMMSAPAGFVEPGESFEDAVRRELWEEAEIEAGDVAYHATQPWPFPYSLMIGCFARAKSERFHLPEGGELEAGNWFSRAEVMAMLEDPQGSKTFLPPPMAIAHHLVRAFLAQN